MERSEASKRYRSLNQNSQKRQGRLISIPSSSLPRATKSAPTLAEVTGEVKRGATIGSAHGWKRFPARRMPGANMDPWKKIASEITPKV